MSDHATDTTNEPVVTLRIEDTIGDTIMVYMLWPSTSMQDNEINILKFEDILELKETYPDTNKDIKIFKIIIKNNLSLNISILN